MSIPHSQKKSSSSLSLTLSLTCLVLALSVALYQPAWSASEERADSQAKKTRTTLQADLGGQVNPEGLALSVGGLRRWSIAKEPGAASPYVQTGLGLAVSPAFAKASVHAEWMPVVFARIRLEYDLYRFSGRYGALLSFPSADSKFGRREVDALEGREESAWGGRVLFQPTLYAKAGKVIISNQTDLAYYRFGGKGPYFLEWEYDTLLTDQDRVAANRTFLLVEARKRQNEAVLLLGPYYELTHAGHAALARRRAGGLVYWVPADTLWSAARPRVYSQIGVNLQDRNREGELFLTLGAGFDFDL